MKKPNASARMLLVFFVVFVLASLTACLAAYFYAERAVTFVVNNFTEYNVSYSKWEGHLFGKSHIKDLAFEVKSKGIKVKAATAYLDINIKESIDKKSLILEARLEKVEFSGLMEKKQAITLQNNVLAIPFAPGHIYDSISFYVSSGKDIFTLAGFKALSEDAKVEGDFTFFKLREEVDMDIKMSFSPKLAGILPGDMRDRVLSLDADGWYSTVIDYKGNVVFLKALYSLAS
jgi:hypothetical protein